MLKFVVVVLVVVVIVWMMIRGRAREVSSSRKAPRDPAPSAMVECLHCGVHLPQSDAVEDGRGAFCTEAHRLAGPRTH